MILAGSLLVASLVLISIRLIMKTFVYKKSTHTRDLTGQLAVVTGGTSGIGRQTVLALLKQGATVVTNGRNWKAIEDMLKLPELAKQVVPGFDKENNFTSDRFHFRICDMSDLN